MYTSVLSFPASVFSDFDRLSRELGDVFGVSSEPASIRSVAPGTFPAINVGHTPTSVEIHAFAPGIDAAKADVSLDRGVLTISGERVLEQQAGQKITTHSRERVGGRFKRVINLPDDVDPDRVQASYRDGVLHISIARREVAQPRRIAIQ